MGSYPNQAIYERDEYKCQYCGLDGSQDFNVWWQANFSVDHLLAKVHDGTEEDSNLVLACHTCNLYKGSIRCETLDEAKAVVRQKRIEAEAWYRKNVLKLEE